MRANIEINDRLMEQAMRATGAQIKRETVEEAFKLMVHLTKQAKLLRAARGKLHWEGDLDEIRRDRFPTK
jgi:Arc/MetJ family transcription regulator